MAMMFIVCVRILAKTLLASWRKVLKCMFPFYDGKKKYTQANSVSNGSPHSSLQSNLCCCQWGVFQLKLCCPWSWFLDTYIKFLCVIFFDNLSCQYFFSPWKIWLIKFSHAISMFMFKLIYKRNSPVIQQVWFLSPLLHCGRWTLERQYQ